VGAAAQSFSTEDQRPLKTFFQDEARFGRMTDPVNCWAPAGLRPLVKTHMVREYTPVFTAACPSDGQTFSLILPFADTPAMQLFLQELSQQFKDCRLVVVMDQAAWHRSKDLGPFENIRILFQPAHSPELNPVEHLWEHIREKYLRNHGWASLEQLEQELEGILKEFTTAADTIRSLVGFHWAII
jgi:putative transposase